MEGSGLGILLDYQDYVEVRDDINSFGDLRVNFIHSLRGIEKIDRSHGGDWELSSDSGEGRFNCNGFTINTGQYRSIISRSAWLFER